MISLKTGGLVFLALSIAAGVGGFIFHHARQTSTIAPPMLQDVYVWRRDWSAAVPHAIQQQHLQFHRFVILTAEISLWQSPAKVTVIHPNYLAISAITREVGLAIRIGPVGGSAVYEPTSPQTQLICSTAVDAIAAVRAAGASVAELQIDFDCAESKLGGYRNWVSAVKSAIAPVPVVVTALPSWLGHSGFNDLARASSGFVMQVHSLHQPTSPDASMMICDPTEAERAVADAEKVGVPFRVALPTYAYLAGFSAEGKFLGLSAEGPLPTWPEGTTLRAMRSDPAAIAPLVAKWMAHAPANMTGIIWYRLPVAGDAMNWSAITLQKVMGGHVPEAKMVADVEHSKPGLVDLFVKNAGEADSTSPLEISIDRDAAILYCEGINGFDRLDSPAGDVIFRDGSTDGRRIAPGERIQVGWLRIAKDREVQAHVTAASSSSK